MAATLCYREDHRESIEAEKIEATKVLPKFLDSLLTLKYPRKKDTFRHVFPVNWTFMTKSEVKF